MRFIQRFANVVQGSRRQRSKAVAFGGPPRKEQALCCQARALPDGRPVIGFCGPLCVRRRP